MRLHLFRIIYPLTRSLVAGFSSSDKWIVGQIIIVAQNKVEVKRRKWAQGSLSVD